MHYNYHFLDIINNNKTKSKTFKNRHLEESDICIKIDVEPRICEGEKF